LPDVRKCKGLRTGGSRKHGLSLSSTDVKLLQNAFDVVEETN